MKAWINWIRKKKCCYITGPDQVWWCLNFCQLQFQRHTFSHVHRCEKWADVMLLLINAVLSESKSVSNTQTIGVWCSVVFFCVCFSLCDKWKSLRVGHSVNWDSAVLWLWCDWKSKWQTQRAFYILYIYISKVQIRDAFWNVRVLNLLFVFLHFKRQRNSTDRLSISIFQMATRSRGRS